MTLNLKVEGQVLRMESNTRIAQGSIGSVVLAFTFDDAWDDYTTKWAIFQYGDAPYFKVQITDGKATAPRFVVAKPYFKVSVRGSDGTNQIASTIEKIYVDYAPQMTTAEETGIWSASSSDGSIVPTKNGENLDLVVSDEYTEGLQTQITANKTAIETEATSRAEADTAEATARAAGDTQIRTDLTSGTLVPFKSEKAIKDQYGNTIDTFYATIQALANHIAEYATLNSKVTDLQSKVVTPAKFEIKYEEATGYIELYYDGTMVSRFDSPLETAFKSVTYNAETKKLTLISASNSVTIDIGDLVDTYTGSNGAEIKVSTENHIITATIQEGAVTRAMLAEEIRNTLLTYDAIIAKYTEIAQAEDLRQTNEISRQNAEAARVNAEKARVSAESARQTTFNTNEANRASTFTTNESVRQTTFDTNESAREAKCEEAIGEVAITDLKESKTYPWRLQISADGQPQFVVITD